MSMIDCCNCGKQISDEARTCPNCGESQFINSDAASLVGSLFVGGAMFWLMNKLCVGPFTGIEEYWLLRYALPVGVVISGFFYIRTGRKKK
ncbi:MAG: zinc ribbon domain-containing protein [Proteobacteria bacterium]|nr:zinc ribbon domain-containing protein [Pseudomonadota bacterium]